MDAKTLGSCPIIIPGLGPVSALTPTVLAPTPNIAYFNVVAGGPPERVWDAQMDAALHHCVFMAWARDRDKYVAAGVSMKGDPIVRMEHRSGNYVRKATLGPGWIESARKTPDLEVRQRVYFGGLRSGVPRPKRDLLDVIVSRCSPFEMKMDVVQQCGLIERPLREVAMDLALRAAAAYSINASGIMMPEVSGASETDLFNYGLTVYVSEMFELSFYHDSDSQRFVARFRLKSSPHADDRVPTGQLKDQLFFRSHINGADWYLNDRMRFGPIESDGIPIAAIEPVEYSG